MRNDLLIIGRDALINKSFEYERLFMILSDKGYDIDNVYAAEKPEDIKSILALSEQSNILAIGDTDALFMALDGCTHDNSQYFKHKDNTFILMPQYDEKYIKDIIIPVLNSKNKIFYNSVIFKVFGKNEIQLRELLKDFIKNKNKITFSFYPQILECEVHIRYSSAVPSVTVNEVIGKVGELLHCSLYATSDISLSEQVSKQIVRKNKKISIMETFTAGGITKTLISNINNHLVESIVLSSESSMINRAGILHNDIVNFGIMSDEVAYNMAGSLFNNKDCDIAITVLGDNLESAEDYDKVFYVAVGDRDVIHVFAEHYFGNITEIREAGVKYALHCLYKFLGEEKNTQ